MAIQSGGNTELLTEYLQKVEGSLRSAVQQAVNNALTMDDVQVLMRADTLYVEQTMVGVYGDQAIEGRPDYVAVWPHEVWVVDIKTAQFAEGVSADVRDQMQRYARCVGAHYRQTIRLGILPVYGKKMIWL